MEAATRAGYVAILGKPNSGKSTLLNRIIGTKLSIVTDKPQTTRKRVVGILSGDDYQAVFLDTPGILEPRYELQRSMMRFVVESIAEADLVIALFDADEMAENPDYIDKIYSTYLDKIDSPKIALLNKVDLFFKKNELLPLMQRLMSFAVFDEVIPISAINGDNIEALIEAISKHLPGGPFYYDAELLSTQPERFFVSELIREKVLEEYHKEVPYSTEVNIIEFKERENGKWFVHAEIIVERDTQKAIIIGDKGTKIKRLGEKARTEIESHLQMPVFLELFVKVRDKWRNKPGMLRSYGY